MQHTNTKKNENVTTSNGFVHATIINQRLLSFPTIFGDNSNCSLSNKSFTNYPEVLLIKSCCHKPNFIREDNDLHNSYVEISLLGIFTTQTRHIWKEMDKNEK